MNKKTVKKKSAKPKARDKYVAIVRRAHRAASVIHDEDDCLREDDMKREAFTKVLDHLLAEKKP